MIGGFWSGGFWSGGYFTESGQTGPLLGGARHFEERIRKGREATEARIRAAKDDELRQIIAELKAEGILPESTFTPRRRTGRNASNPEADASREAQIQHLIISVQVAIGTMERARLAAQEDDAVALLMLI